jgi:hypothetical protein
MLNKLFTCIHYTLFVILFNDYLRRNYPEKYFTFLTNISFELIRFYSKCQIIYNQNKKNIKMLIDNNPEIKKILSVIHKKNYEKNEIYKVTNNSIHIKQYFGDNEKYFEEEKNSIYLFCDNERDPENECKNIVVSHLLPIHTAYEVSEVRFLLTEVIVYDKTYKIDLKNDKFNYYIVNNILDLKFFKYYLYVYGICNLTQEEKDNITKIILKIIDQNVNKKELEITDDKFIIIKKESYIY